MVAYYQLNLVIAIIALQIHSLVYCVRHWQHHLFHPAVTQVSRPMSLHSARPLIYI